MNNFQIWSLLLHCPTVVQCLCTFTDQPVVSSLVLSRLAKSLAHESHDWYFYEDSLLKLSETLSKSAVAVVDSVHRSAPNKAYQLLCQPLDNFHGATLSQLAYQPSSYYQFDGGYAYATPISPVKMLLIENHLQSLFSISADIRKKARAVSAYSVVSGRSEVLSAVAGAYSVPQLAFTEPATPQSMVFPTNVEDVDGEDTLMNTVYPARVMSACFLLYWCYATIFIYIPLSEVFGPTVVRVKLMILRDFTNFLILVALVMSSSAAAIHAVLYPDRDISISVARSSLSWVWLSLFTTDLSNLKESDTCKKAFLGPSTSYCSFVGEYSNTSCPSQSVAGYIVILEYFVLLKLILWPVLFAFFAKTAKTVDEEADKIWKFQIHRPPLPPPLTPLFFICMACSCAGAEVGDMMSNHPDHPDVDHHRDRTRSTVRFGSVYHKASISAKKTEFVNAFWRQLMIERWRDEAHVKNNLSMKYDIKSIQKHLRILLLSSSYSATGHHSKCKMDFVPYADTDVKRLAVAPSERSWEILLPRYSPPFYCRPVEDFSSENAKYVEIATGQNVAELRHIWRTRQALDSGRDWLLSAAGYPLNPRGRRGMSFDSLIGIISASSILIVFILGIAGRGSHPRFGANKRCYYIILIGTVRSQCEVCWLKTSRSSYDDFILVLLDTNHNLPNNYHYENGTKDEYLASLLRTIGVAESDAQVKLKLFSTRQPRCSFVDSSDSVATTDTNPLHIATLTVEQDIDTDHAWTEQDLWAIVLKNRKVLSSIVGYSWHSVNSLTSLSTIHQETVLKVLKAYDIV
ncbi:hypothetical protein DICVIV_03075 [Dictyocaulus viviparus]|uniref:Uncharacterized protein n=1 Tax=Dictyocaulus viviparus TaxID=29172 RepID=A0A0D8Y416_DICVI|nr:hypothetical protein DICVIV_03075 [Dictyocaulus viviparus]